MNEAGTALTDPNTNITTKPSTPNHVPPGVEYHRVLAGDKRRIGRGILAIVLVVGGLQVFTIALTLGIGFVEAQRGYLTPVLGGTDYTPLYHAVSIASVALLIPWSMLVQRWLYGVPGRSLHSVVSRFRFDLFGRSLLILGPILVAVLVVYDYLAPTEKQAMDHTTALWIFVTSLVFVPLQAAGEEYGFRGLLFRVAASWGRGPRTALVLGLLVSSAAFAVVHATANPWLNLWYLVFGITTGIIVWRTGGIEVAVVLHAVFNTVGFTLDVALRTSFVSAAGREGGAANAYLLVGVFVWIAVAAVVWIGTRKSGPARTPIVSVGDKNTVDQERS